MLKNIKLGLWTILIGITGVWLLSNAPFSETLNFFKVRHLLVQYSGVITIAVMSIAMMLALRPVWLEPWLGGLDKTYRLHKWLGISALIIATSHWVAVNGPHWLVDLGLMESPQRKGSRHAMTQDSVNTLEKTLHDFRHTAESIGEWAFYAVALLIALALIKRFPYRLFAKTHTLIAIAYLALVLHSVVLMDFAAWTQIQGIVIGLLLAAGSFSAVIILCQQKAKRRQVEGIIETIHHIPDMKILETSIRLKDGWKGHKSGQFAFVKFDPEEGQHPFTIASAWDADNPSIAFITKALGDYTELLPEKLNIGDKAIVEGPYGTFTFDDSAPRQIWVGGGIGITPFIARMKQLALTPGTQVIDLFHSTTELAPEALAKLTADAVAAKVKLHLFVDSRDGVLTGEKLRDIVPDWQSASVWFCGPAGFGTALCNDLTKNGLPRGSFYQELFNMR
ncbi:MAG: ferric reductase-like transmembrane domain-containing protein [Spongiibacteraceae bacterium]